MPLFCLTLLINHHRRFLVMFSFLKNHPFAVEARFENSLVLTYAAPKEELQKLIPAYLTLDTFQDTWAFVAVALVSTKGLRPKGFPECFGNNFFLAGYRIFVRYTSSTGKRLRGLYILKSESDKRLMAFLGNLFSHYQYSLTDINYRQEHSSIKIQSRQSGLNVEVAINQAPATLPVYSPFADWKEARRFAGPLPFTFSHNGNTVIMIEGVRENWTPQPVEVITAQVPFIEQMNISSIVLANAFLIQNIPYYWKRGKTDLWKKETVNLLKAY